MISRARTVAVFACISACTSDPAPGTLEAGSGESITFSCADGAAVSMRFLGPETIELHVAGDRHVLLQERSASGAKYVADCLLYTSDAADE